MSTRHHSSRRRSFSEAEELEPRRLLSAAVAFAAPTAYGTGSSLGVVAVDLNGDGHLDVVSPNSASGGSDGVSVSLNTGTGALTSPVSYTTSNSSLSGFQPYALATADFNGDGHADIASANYGSGTLSILFGDGNGALGNTAVYTAGNTPDGIAVGDFNGDGHPDIVVANRGDNDVSVFLNNGDGTFAPAVSYAVGSSPNGVAVGNLSGDGYPDIVVADTGSNQLTELVNSGNGTFTTITDNIVGSASDVKLADMNNDGQLDIIAGIGGSSPGIDVLLNAGSNVFNPTFVSTSTTPVDLTIADFNNDGNLDVASADLNNQVGRRAAGQRRRHAGGGAVVHHRAEFVQHRVWRFERRQQARPHRRQLQPRRHVGVCDAAQHRQRAGGGCAGYVEPVFGRTGRWIRIVRRYCRCAADG